jgi:hypothetical protein
MSATVLRSGQVSSVEYPLSHLRSDRIPGCFVQGHMHYLLCSCGSEKAVQNRSEKRLKYIQ